MQVRRPLQQLLQIGSTLSHFTLRRAQATQAWSRRWVVCDDGVSTTVDVAVGEGDRDGDREVMMLCAEKLTHDFQVSNSILLCRYVVPEMERKGYDGEDGCFSF